MKQLLKSNQIEAIYTTCTEERETTFTVLSNDQKMDIYTSDNTMLTKLKRVLENNPNTVECWEAGRNEDNKVTGYFFRMDKKHLSIRNVAGREVSEEQRAAASNRFKKLAAEGKLGRKK